MAVPKRDPGRPISGGARRLSLSTGISASLLFLSPCNEPGPMAVGPTAPNPGGQDGHEEFAPPPLHTHTLTHPNQLEARGMGRVQKEVSKEDQEGVREKSLQCGARWGENGKGQGALRVQGWGVRREGPEGAARVQSHPGWGGGLLGTGKSQIK